MEVIFSCNNQPSSDSSILHNSQVRDHSQVYVWLTLEFSCNVRLYQIWLMNVKNVAVVKQSCILYSAWKMSRSWQWKGFWDQSKQTISGTSAKPKGGK